MFFAFLSFSAFFSFHFKPGKCKKTQLKVTQRPNNSPVRELIFERRRLKSLNISARDSLYSKRRYTLRENERRTRTKKAAEIDERRKKMRRTGVDRENEGAKKEKERTRRIRRRSSSKRWERRRDARIFLWTTTLSGQTRGRLILLHVMQISRERCPSAFRAGSCLADPCTVSRQVRKDDRPPPRSIQSVEWHLLMAICGIYY